MGHNPEGERHDRANQYLGVGVGEHLGYLFTGIWSVLIGVGVIQAAVGVALIA